ncbi:Rad4 transglutaminase-like domain-containing protein [Macrophomina phaseolina]|uniref:Rad4 transglutaminase-like domain-containing protein n=1 Tax=Macrophomina phaseolina TaxID=35725 RepID=A0ABQ8G890_9PEZI|nr:Rad4 transglutaminase-like domain-containing protein [Macrophomina phaseolina]
MPPFVPRKRDRSRSPAPAVASASKRSKKNVFDALDAPSAKPASSADQAFLDALNSESSDGELSDADSDDFEEVDVDNPKNERAGKAAGGQQANGADNGEDDEDEMDWEDALASAADTPSHEAPQPRLAPWQRALEEENDVLQVSLGGPAEGDDEIARKKALGIKGPSKKERQLRIWTHCMHVQLLLWHNHIRNGWACDREVQEVLVHQLPDGVKKEVQHWRRDSGLPPDESLEPPKKARGKKGVNGIKGKGKGKERSDRHSERNQRDWGGTAGRMEEGVPNMSQGDPTLRLLKYLAAYWKKRFRITAPGLRKKGYFPTAKSLASEVKAWEAAEEGPSEKKNSHKRPTHVPEDYDVQRFGERIHTKAEFLEAARQCEGSRDVGAQLFTALVRGLGLEARMVASLQPIGFGFTKGEEVVMKKGQTGQPDTTKQEEEPVPNSKIKAASTPGTATTKKQNKPAPKPQKPQLPNGKRSSHRKSGTKPLPIELDDDSDSSLSSAKSDISDASIIEITPSKPVSRPRKSYDVDLKFPIYWTEVLSPISKTYIPVSPLVISTVASTPDLLSSFEPRGAAAEKAKQVICYVIGYNADGSAKDVTVRYLKKHIWPGKTKGFRMPVEKIPVYNKHGKIRRYEEFDWFKHVMSSYTRDGRLRTEADKLEDEGDLVPIKPSNTKKSDSSDPQTLQDYKNSAEFVLERHLRREEAIRPSSKPVKTFMAGKGDKAKPEPVFLRKDVVICKTAESWHKEGRQILPGSLPMKRVPMRAVTLIRKREIEEAERESGEKAMQGLYAREQTEWIIPPPIVNGKIPKNAYGNIDVYVPTMVPPGATHVPLRGAARVCKKLEIDFAEACTGFEFGRQIAVPVLTGVVVAEENAEMVREAWEAEQAAKREKEEKKRREAALKMWRKFLLGLRVIERVKEEYGEGRDGLDEVVNPFARKNRNGEVGNTFERKFGDEFEDELEGGFVREAEGPGSGGFLREGEGEDPGPGGFFLPGEEEEDVSDGGFIKDDHKETGECGFLREDEEAAEGGGFIIEGDDTKKSQGSYEFETTGTYAPISLQSAPQNLIKDPSDDTQDNLKDEESEDESSEPVTRPTPTRSRGAPKGQGRGRGRAAGSKIAASTRCRASRSSGKRKSSGASGFDEDGLSSAPSDLESSGSSFPQLDDESESASDIKPTCAKVVSEETPRRTPRRAAARKSATAVKSHYFDDAEGADEVEVDRAEEGSEDVEAKLKPKTRTARDGRGRGRGRGRGKAT